MCIAVSIIDLATHTRAHAYLRPNRLTINQNLLDIRYTVNGAVSGFGPLIVSTFGYSPLESILFQFPLGAICAIGIPLTGYICMRYRNLRIPTLILCCLPVIAGYVIIWKSSWGVRPAAPVAGYSIIGFFGPVVGLTVSLGAANVAGETKKSFMAAAVFVAYCVGNIVGPQLVKSETKGEHYPGLWTGLIVSYVPPPAHLPPYSLIIPLPLACSLTLPLHPP